MTIKEKINYFLSEDAKISYDGKKYKLHKQFNNEVALFMDIDDKDFMPIISDNTVVGGMIAYPGSDGIELIAIYTVSAMRGQGIAKQAIGKLYDKFKLDKIIGNAVETSISFWKSLGAKMSKPDKNNDIYFELSKKDFIKRTS